MTLSLIGYDPVGVWTKTMENVADIVSWKNPAGQTWINVDGFDRPDEINRLAEIFKIHPLTVEDILDPSQRPKAEEIDSYLFITLKAVSFAAGVDFRHISLIITRDTILTFQDSPSSYFETIKKRIVNNTGRLRQKSADFLAYSIIDAVIDEYFSSIDLFGMEIEDFEDRVIEEKDDDFIQDIQMAKRKLLKMRRAVWPLRESITMLIHFDSRLISDDLTPFLKDLYEHVIQVSESIETYRELLSGIMEINLTVSSNRLGKVMKVLTIISTIFIPLTFIAGVYGMNFDYMPELYAKPAYFIVWGIMISIAGGMLLFFKKRKWI